MPTQAQANNATTTQPPAESQPSAPAPTKIDLQASHVYTYGGPAAEFRTEEGADPVGPGAKVSLTGKQVRLLMKSGHRFRADSQVGQAVIDSANAAMRAERQRLEAEAAAKKSAGQ